jgi:membrane protein
MRILGNQARQVLAHPGRFLLQTVKAFRANQGLLLAGAVAYYALLSIVTLVSGSLQALGEESVSLFGREWSLSGFSGVLLYLLGLVGEVFVLTSVYLVMPVGRLALRHALIGGVTAALLWEVTRHVLVWYFGTLSQVNVVYGSMTTAIVVLLSLEIAAGLLLFGAQVISQYEQLERGRADAAPKPFRTD